jgi:hypothetical protein
VLAEPAGRSGDHEPAYQLWPVRRELQGDGAARRDAEYVDRFSELLIERNSVVVGQVLHRRSVRQSDPPAYPANREGARQGS